MANSIQQDRQGPDWPLGLITVAAAGTPVNIMSVVDSTSANAPGTPTGLGQGLTSDEYTMRCQQIIIQAVRSVAPIVDNTGIIYIMRKGVTPGLGNRTDSGSIVAIIRPGQTFTFASAPLNRNVFSPYRYSIDADTNGDGALVTLIIQ